MAVHLEDAPTGGARAGVLRRHRWPIAVTVVMIGLESAYSLLWDPVVRHHPGWVYPPDIWGAIRSAHFIGWGDLGAVYSAGTELITFPGILIFFAPVAMLTGRFGLTESFPFYPPHPTAWLVFGPYEVLISCSILFACNSLAQRLGVGTTRRAWLCVAQGVALWNVCVIWGHPEDALALALAIYALLFALEGRWTITGWMFGAAVATQPLVLLVLPVLLAMAGKRQAPALLMRSAIPAIALLAVPLIAEFHTTVHSLIDQPNYPRVDHVTPWTHLAPRLGGSGKDFAIAAGPGRIVAVALAGLLGWRARRWREPEVLVLAAAGALALRCLTESVMVAYYAWPVLALGLVVAARRSPARWLAAVAAALAVTVCGDIRFGAWPWWTVVNGGLFLVLLAGMPSRVRAGLPITVDAVGSKPPTLLHPLIDGRSAVTRRSGPPRVAGLARR